MDSRRFPLSRILLGLAAQVLLFGLGAAAMAAWSGGLYASLVLSLGLAGWLGTIALLRLLPPRHARQPSSPATEHEQAERTMLRAVMMQAPVPLLAVEDSGRIRALNRAARTLFDTDDLVFSPPPALCDGSARVQCKGRVLRIDRIVAHDAGPARAILVLVDVEAEARMAEARTTRELLQVLSHEVMNALTPVASLSESALDLLEAPSPPVAPLRDILGTLARRTGGLLDFTRAYRELARLPEPVIATTEIPALFTDLQRMFAARWGSQVTLQCSAPANLTLRADREQLGQALWALLQNGAEAALETSDTPTVSLDAHVQEHILFRVSDNGPGIPPEQKRRIFLPFVTTKAKGNGVGLSLAQQIVHGHGGELILIDHEAHGACFEIKLANA